MSCARRCTDQAPRHTRELCVLATPAPLWLQWQGLPRFAEAFAGDLAAALKIPAHAVVVVETAVTSQPNVETVVTSRPKEPQRGSLAAAAAVVGITMATSPPPRANAGGANVVVAVFDLLPRSSQQDSASAGSRPSTRSTRLGLLAAKMAVNRRVDALAAALSLASDFSGLPPRKELVGPLAISTRAQQGAATRAIERAAGLRQVSADGQRTRVWPIDSETLLSSIPLSSESWVMLVQRFTPSKPVSAWRHTSPGLLPRQLPTPRPPLVQVQGVDPEVIVRKAMTSARTEGCTVGQLAKVLHYEATDSIGDLFSQHAQFFKVFGAYTNNQDNASKRVNACKKIEVLACACPQRPAG